MEACSEILRDRPQAEITCPICLKTLSHKGEAQNFSFSEYFVAVCGVCTIKQLVAKSGLLVCCNCRLSVGTRLPARIVNELVAAMLASITKEG